MSTYRHISTLQDQQDLLEEIILLEQKIRRENGQKRILKNNKHKKLSTIFQPVTSSIQSLKQPQKEDTEELLKIDPEELQNEEILTPDNLESPQNLTTGNITPFNEESKENDLYTQALNQISRKLLDDGVFGLDSQRRIINGRPYNVKNNILTVFNEDGSQKDIHIDDINVWKVLLAQNPL